MNVRRVNSYFLIGFKACFMEGKMVLVLIKGTEVMVAEFTAPWVNIL